MVHHLLVLLLFPLFCALFLPSFLAEALKSNLRIACFESVSAANYRERRMTEVLSWMSALDLRWAECRRAKPGRFGSLALAMKIGTSGESAPGHRQGKHENMANSGCLCVCVPNPGKQSIWRQSSKS